MRLAKHMRVLIQNYSTNNSTEPMYLCQCLQSSGLTAALWNPSQSSAFDAFDTIKPDVFITKFEHFNNDIYKWLIQSQQTQCVINMTGAQQEHVGILDQMSEKLNIPFVFTNEPKGRQKLKEGKVKIHGLLPAHDVFLDAIPSVAPDYEIELGILAGYDSRSRTKEIYDNFESYHFLSTESSLTDSLDVTAPIMNLASLLSRYKNIVISEDGPNINQVLFEALAKCDSVFYKCKYESHQDKIVPLLQKILGSKEGLEFNKKSVSFKSRVMEKHTCFNRASSLAKLLKAEELSRNINNVAKEFLNDNSNS